MLISLSASFMVLVGYEMIISLPPKKKGLTNCAFGVIIVIPQVSSASGGMVIKSRSLMKDKASLYNFNMASG